MSSILDRDTWVGMAAGVSGPPGKRRLARVTHHGVRVLLVVLLAVSTALLFPTGSTRGPDDDFMDWVVAPQDVVAEVAFDVRKGPEEFEAERAEAMAAVEPTFDYVPGASDSMAVRVARGFALLDSAASASGTVGLATALLEWGMDDPEGGAELLANPETRTNLAEAAVGSVSELPAEGLIEADNVASIAAGRVTIRGVDGGESSRTVDGLVTGTSFIAQAVRLLPPGTSEGVTELFREILGGHLDYTLRFNQFATETDRNEASAQISPVRESVLPAQVIVRQGDPVGDETRDRLRAHREGVSAAGGIDEAEDGGWIAALASVLLYVILLGVFGLVLLMSRPIIYQNFRWLLLMALLVGSYFGSGFLIGRADLSGEWLPIVFVAFPVALLWDSRVALCLSFVLVAVTGTLPPFQGHYATLLALFVAGSLASLSAIVVRRRAQVWLAIVITSVLGSFVLLTDSLINGAPITDWVMRAGMLASNVTASSLLSVMMIFVYEIFTGITTRQTLTEWADPTRPLLRRLAVDAPGSYAHSLGVAGLAESAAERVGADGLLTRVGAYYHDIGKALRPIYFVENQPDGHNPHDDLAPVASADIVRRHVTDGERMAREAKVPRVLLPFIKEHHGDQVIGFFLNKAREEAQWRGEQAESIDEGDFRYPGPRPQSLETAIVMCADSCESAVRAMHNPTPERIRHLIDGIVDRKVADGQFDESPITLREISQVKHEFAKVLTGAFHRRIEYPETKHLTGGEAADETGSGPSAEDEASESAWTEGEDARYRLETDPEE